MSIVDIRIDEKYIFVQQVDSHTVHISDDGKTATITLELTEAIDVPDVPAVDIDDVYARLREEGNEQDQTEEDDVPDNDDPAADDGDHHAENEFPENEPGSIAVSDDDNPDITAEDTTDADGGPKAKRGRKNS